MGCAGDRYVCNGLRGEIQEHLPKRIGKENGISGANVLLRN